LKGFGAEEEFKIEFCKGTSSGKWRRYKDTPALGDMVDDRLVVNGADLEVDLTNSRNEKDVVPKTSSLPDLISELM